MKKKIGDKITDFVGYHIFRLKSLTLYYCNEKNEEGGETKNDYKCCKFLFFSISS